ncbi:MAG: endonuclease/exonuclease/phosphatase family protein [Devosiaceae bacterium]|nr:endonuclease/exonuclease/phosphatase family protein [Devosiaceae bacterium MH13]
MTSPTHHPRSLFARRWQRYRPRHELLGWVTLALLALIVAAALPHLFPETLLRHLDQGRLHAGAGLLVCGAVFAVLGSVLRAVLSAALGAGLLLSVGLSVPASFASHTHDRAADLSVLSFNILGTNRRDEDLMGAIETLDADVSVLLEVPALHRQQARLSALYPYQVGCLDDQPCDMAVYSRYPIAGERILGFHTIFGRLIVAPLETPGGSVTLVAAHFTKPYFGRAHDLQMDVIIELMANLDGPVVLVGDFNSQPFVEAFRTSLFERAELRLASRMEPTWPALPSLALSRLGFAIDHVLVRGDVTPVAVQLVDDPVGSNHRGFLSTFDLDGR